MATRPPRASDMRALVVCVCLYLNHAAMASIGVLSRSKNFTLDPDHEVSEREFCRQHRRDPSVRRFCVSEPAVIHTIVQGMRNTVDTCQLLFKWDHWQCDLLQDRKNLLKKVYPETAFVYALTAAGVVHSVAQGCRTGRLSHRCSCGESGREEPEASPGLQQGWKWGGCGDNYPFAAKFVRRLLSRESGKRPRTLRKPVDTHNIIVGIRTLRRGIRPVCKCHGVSGSCSLKTCWRELAPFPEVARRLKRKYIRAVPAEIENKPEFAATDVVAKPRKVPAATAGTTQRPKWLAAVTARLRRLGRDRLVYLEKSPSFCEPNPLTGSGMTGRRCRDPDHCNKVCCGSEHRSFNEVVYETCQCRMVWCCKLECKTCENVTTAYACL